MCLWHEQPVSLRRHYPHQVLGRSPATSSQPFGSRSVVLPSLRVRPTNSVAAFRTLAQLHHILRPSAAEGVLPPVCGVLGIPGSCHYPHTYASGPVCGVLGILRIVRYTHTYATLRFVAVRVYRSPGGIPIRPQVVWFAVVWVYPNLVSIPVRAQSCVFASVWEYLRVGGIPEPPQNLTPDVLCENEGSQSRRICRRVTRMEGKWRT